MVIFNPSPRNTLVHPFPFIARYEILQDPRRKRAIPSRETLGKSPSLCSLFRRWCECGSRDWI
jgi:hypothetical protein